MLPLIYDSILPAELKALWIDEGLDCQKCEMSCGSSPIYRSDLKCCTYRPFLSNYLIGELLSSSGDALVQEQLLKQIQAREFATPMGFIAPEAYQMLFSYKKGSDFGNTEELLCPYYDKGSCRVWRSRSSECLQFHCRSDYGGQGLEFWQAFGELLYDVEILCSQMAMLHQGFDWEEVEKNSEMIKIKKFEMNSEKFWNLSKEQSAELWQHKASDIEQYYKQCYDFVKTDPSLILDVKDLVLKHSQVFSLHNKIFRSQR